MCDDVATRQNGNPIGQTNNNENTRIHYLKIIRPERSINYEENTTPKKEAASQKQEPAEVRLLRDEIRDAPGGLADAAKHGRDALASWVIDNAALLKYVLDDQASLEMRIDNKGNTVGHFLASISEEYALKILADPKKAAIANNEGDSICLAAVKKYPSAAALASNSLDLWRISNPNTGDTVGHNIAKTHESIIIEILSRADAVDFLSVENDRRATVANTGTIHRKFSLLVLDHSELYSLPLGSECESVACDAVKNHFSSARKAESMLRDRQMQMSNIGQYSALEIAVKDKLADLAERNRNGNGVR